MAGFTYVWEYEVPSAAEPEFLAQYGAEGGWSRLFRRAPGYLGTQLYRDRNLTGRYLTVDHWRDEASFREFQRRFAAEYEALDRLCAGLTRREARLGDFEPVTLSDAPAGAVECIVPILRVRSVQDSLRYYEQVLGFTVEWGHEPGAAMASVARNGRSIMLCEGDQGRPGTWIWIGVDDIGPLYDRLLHTGAKIRQAPARQPWAYELQVEDPDGHVLRFGSDPLPETL